MAGLQLYEQVKFSGTFEQGVFPKQDQRSWTLRPRNRLKSYKVLLKKVTENRFWISVFVVFVWAWNEAMVMFCGYLFSFHTSISLLPRTPISHLYPNSPITPPLTTSHTPTPHLFQQTPSNPTEAKPRKTDDQANNQAK